MKIKLSKGAYTLIYNGILPLLSLILLIIRLNFANYTAFNYFVSSVYDLRFCLYSLVFGFTFYRFVDCVQINNKIDNTLLDLPDARCKVKCAVAGAGKTFSGVNELCLRSERMWYDLAHEYWELSNIVNTSKFQNDLLLKTRYRKVKFGFDFWKDYDGMKCAASNIGVEYKGKKCYELTREMIEQKQFLPPFTVCLIDEVSSFFTNDESNSFSKNYRAEDTNRWARHFDLCFIYTEQNPENVVKFIRNVVSENERMKGVKTIYTANFALNLINSFGSYLYEHKINGRLVVLFRRLKDIFNKVGYFQFDSEIYGNLLFDGLSKSITSRKLYIHKDLDFEYDTHCFAKLNLTLDMPNDLKMWRVLNVQKNSNIYKSIIKKYEKQEKRENKKSV